jgi:hypothetical protein
MTDRKNKESIVFPLVCSFSRRMLVLQSVSVSSFSEQASLHELFPKKQTYGIYFILRSIEKIRYHYNNRVSLRLLSVHQNL